MDTHNLANDIGRAKMASALDIGLTAISKYTATRDQFPPAWFDIMEGLCAEMGIDCPRALFSFKSVTPSNGPILRTGDASKVSCRDNKGGGSETQGQVSGGAV